MNNTLVGISAKKHNYFGQPCKALVHLSNLAKLHRVHTENNKGICCLKESCKVLVERS